MFRFGYLKFLGQPYLMWQLPRQPELVWSIKSKSYVKIGLDYITFKYRCINKK